MAMFGSAGAVVLFLGVALGAFAAHALEAKLEPRMLNAFEVGVRYQLLHGLALVLVALLVERQPAFAPAGWAYLVGVILFSGSLYGLALTGIRPLGMITPLGGLAFLAGHALLLVGFLKSA